MPEMIRKPVEPVKVGEGIGDAATGTSSTSATPATSNAPSPSPAATPTPTPTSTSGTGNETNKTNSDSSEAKECRDESKDKEVGIICMWYNSFVKYFLYYVTIRIYITISLVIYKFIINLLL